MSALRSPAVKSSRDERLECGRLALRAAEVIRSGPFAHERAGVVMLALANLRTAVLCFTHARTRAASEPSDTAGGASLESPTPEVRAALERGIDDDLGADPNRAWKDLELLKAYGERLLWDLEEPARRARAARRHARARTLAGPFLALALLTLAAFWLFGSRDVSTGKHWTTSSVYAPCDPIRKRCADVETAILFHTLLEPEPWFEIDLGRIYEVSRIAVRNRSDCCREAAVPLVVETSLDRKQYRTMARKLAVFDDWEQRLPATRARYVRLRVTRTSILHLEAVRVFGHRVD